MNKSKFTKLYVKGISSTRRVNYISRELMETDFFPQGRKVLTTREYSKRI